ARGRRRGRSRLRWRLLGFRRSGLLRLLSAGLRRFLLRLLPLLLLLRRRRLLLLLLRLLSGLVLLGLLFRLLLGSRLRGFRRLFFGFFRFLGFAARFLLFLALAPLFLLFFAPLHLFGDAALLLDAPGRGPLLDGGADRADDQLAGADRVVVA